MISIPYFIEILIHRGLEVTVEYSKQYGGVYFDLHTGMKSHCHLVKSESGYTAFMRYEKTAAINGMAELLEAVRSCQHGRPYANPVWREILNLE